MICKVIQYSQTAQTSADLEEGNLSGTKLVEIELLPGTWVMGFEALTFILHFEMKKLNLLTVDLSQTTLFSSVDLNLPDELVISTQPTRDVRKKMFKSIPQFSEPRFSELSRASVDRSSISARSQENKTADYYVVNARGNV